MIEGEEEEEEVDVIIRVLAVVVVVVLRGISNNTLTLSLSCVSLSLSNHGQEASTAAGGYTDQSQPENDLRTNTPLLGILPSHTFRLRSLVSHTLLIHSLQFPYI